MNPPRVYELTTPRNHRTNKTTKSVHNMALLAKWSREPSVCARTPSCGETVAADHAAGIHQSTLCASRIRAAGGTLLSYYGRPWTLLCRTLPWRSLRVSSYQIVVHA